MRQHRVEPWPSIPAPFAMLWAVSHRGGGGDRRWRARAPISASRLILSPRCRWIRRWCCGAWTGARAAMRFRRRPGLHRFHSWHGASRRCRRGWRGRANKPGRHRADADRTGPAGAGRFAGGVRMRARKVLEGGDHTILIGRVLRFCPARQKRAAGLFPRQIQRAGAGPPEGARRPAHRRNLARRLALSQRAIRNRS